MALTTGPNLGLLVNGAAGEAHYAELMKLFRGLDLLVMPCLKDKDLATPPGSPADGDAYIVASSPTGAWSGNAKAIARWSSVAAAWEFYTPKEGWSVYLQDEDSFYDYNGSAWVIRAPSGTPSIITETGTSRTLAAGDVGKYIRCTNAAGCTITVPTGLAQDGEIYFRQAAGAGQITFAGSGMTIETAETLKTRKAGSGAMIKITNPASAADLTGDLELAP